MLGESIHSHFNIVVLYGGDVQARLRAAIIGGLVHIRDHRHIVRRAVIAGLVVVIEGRNRQHRFGLNVWTQEKVT